MQGRIVLDQSQLALLIKSVAVKDDPLLVLYLCLDITDCIRWLDLKGDGLAIEHLHENLHAEVEVQGRIVLDDFMIVSKYVRSSSSLLPAKKRLWWPLIFFLTSVTVSDGSFTWSVMVLLVRVCT